MEDKYFIPNIEDIRIGYECEICDLPHIEGFSYMFPRNSEYRKFIVTKEFLQLALKHCDEYCLKTSYLTKEQIEAEGWKVEKQSLGTYLRGVKKLFISKHIFGNNWDYNVPVEYGLTYNHKSHELKIYREIPGDFYDFTHFNGECKDINTFRYLCKLLNIET
jgi:hypothetical protein